MSCPHGNHPDACDICDEVEAAYNSGVEAERQRREWVNLTDEEFNDAINYKLTPRCIAIAVEAKLKEKNT